MFVKRLINVIVTVPLLLAVSGILFSSIGLISWWMMDIGNSTSSWLLKTSSMLIGGVVSAVVFCAGLCCIFATLPVIFTGSGLLCKRVRKNDSLTYKNGQIFCVFIKDDLIWRFDPLLIGKKFFVCFF